MSGLTVTCYAMFISGEACSFLKGSVGGGGSGGEGRLCVWGEAWRGRGGQTSQDVMCERRVDNDNNKSMCHHTQLRDQTQVLRLARQTLE